MSKKQNKKNSRKKETIQVEKELSKTVWPLECEAIPLSELNTEEQDVVLKCIDHENFTDEEFKLLKEVLARYRPYIDKHKPKETVEEYEEVKKLIKTEQDLIDILDNRNRTLLVCLPIDGENYEMEFEVLPITDSRLVDALDFQVSIFQDFSTTEKQVYAKAQTGQVISKEEEAILKKMEEEINSRAGEEVNKACDDLLANQLRLQNSSQDLNKRLEFWNKFPFSPKFSIYYKIMDKLGLTDYNNEQLFPSSE